MAALLSYEQAPPLSVPYRFFLSAPLFAAAAGLLLAWRGDEVLATRWSMPALAITHLMTIGFLLQVMCGALMQILPVAVGTHLWRARAVALATHVGMSLGAMLLPAAFLLEKPALFAVAVPVLAGAVAVFVAVVAAALLRAPVGNDTVRAMRVAMLGLAITVALGATLGWSFVQPSQLPIIELTHLHAAWGLSGWGLVLLVGVAYLVVPMFQLTPPYREKLARWLPTALAAVLAAWSLLWLAGQEARYWRILAFLAGAGLVVWFVLATLGLQRRRRRKVVDATLRLWQAGMVCMLLAVLLAAALDSAEGELRNRLEVAVAILMLQGVFGSVIVGMLYKIMPFLNWLHLQQVLGQVPSMRQMLSEQAMMRHARMHMTSVVLLLAAVALPVLMPVAGLALVVTSLWLEANVVRIARAYRRARAGSGSALAAAVPPCGGAGGR